MRLETWLDTRLDNRINTCTIIDHGTIVWVNIIKYILLNPKSKLYSLNLWNKPSWPMSVSFHIGRIPHWKEMPHLFLAFNFGLTFSFSHCDDFSSLFEWLDISMRGNCHVYLPTGEYLTFWLYFGFYLVFQIAMT